MAFPSYGPPADYGQEVSDDSLRYGFHANADTCGVAASHPSCHAFYRGFSITERIYQSSVVYHRYCLSAIKNYPAC